MLVSSFQRGCLIEGVCSYYQKGLNDGFIRKVYVLVEGKRCYRLVTMIIEQRAIDEETHNPPLILGTIAIASFPKTLNRFPLISYY